MSVEWLSCALMLLVIVQHVYWSRIVMRMTDKLMSRSYAEWAQVKRFEEQRPREQAQDDEPAVDPEDERQAAQLNSLVGIG